ncbi:MAG: YybH family protein [Alphaproteobacteria bacterium]|jgi:ketosteroid isomerase-like protein
MTAHHLPDADVAAIKDTLNSFTRCLKAKDFANWATYWTKDGTLMPPNQPRVAGPEALVDFIRKNYGNGHSMTLTDWQIIGEGTLAVATTNVHVAPNGEKPSEELKQLIVLSKEAADKWQLKMVAYNAGV